MSVTKPTLRSEAKFSVGLQLLTYRRLLLPPLQLLETPHYCHSKNACSG
jgi:hypothetical protein